MTTPDEAQTLLPVTPELLPCGNCGAPARWIKNAWRIKCTRPSCGVEGGKFEQKHVAITAWNTRSQSHSLPGEPAFVRDDQCNVEFGTVPDCDCPHEHWHMGGGGICLDVHIEEDRTGHAILGNDDWQLEVSGVENLDEMRAIAFAWAKQKYALTPSPCPGDVGTAETLDDLVNKPVGGDFSLRAFNVVRCLAKAEFRSEIDRCKDEAEYLMASLKESGLPDYLRIAFPEMSAALTPSALSGDAGEVYLRLIDAGSDNECWTVCAKGDPGAVAFVEADQ